MRDSYCIVDEFRVKDQHVIVLDRDFDSAKTRKAVIDGCEYEYCLNSVRRWIALKNSSGAFRGKTVDFK